MMFDEDQIYTKFSEIYNFVVDNCFIWSRFDVEICITIFYKVNAKRIDVLYSHEWMCNDRE